MTGTGMIRPRPLRPSTFRSRVIRSRTLFPDVLRPRLFHLCMSHKKITPPTMHWLGI
jgi:hypothetical protein